MVDALSFTAEDHKYRDGERELVSATQLLELMGLSKDLSFLKLDPVYRHKGEAVHEVFRLIDSGAPWRETWGHEQILPYAKQIENFKRDSGFCGRVWELPMADRKRGIGGKLDALGECGGEIWLIDAKTGSIQICSVGCQLAAYKDLLLNGEVIDDGSLCGDDYAWLDFARRNADRIRLKSLNLKSDGAPYVLRSHDEPRWASIWRAAVTLYNARKEFGLLK